MRFNTKIIGTGDRYGRADCLTNEGGPMIEFYDPRHVKHGPLGQFISRYYVSTILERDTGGLALQGDIPEWTVSAHDMAEIRVWLRKIEVAA